MPADFRICKAAPLTAGCKLSSPLSRSPANCDLPCSQYLRAGLASSISATSTEHFVERSEPRHCSKFVEVRRSETPNQAPHSVVGNRYIRRRAGIRAASSGASLEQSPACPSQASLACYFLVESGVLPSRAVASARNLAACSGWFSASYSSAKSMRAFISQLTLGAICFTRIS
jgi:hypothetical protein